MSGVTNPVDVVREALADELSFYASMDLVCQAVLMPGCMCKKCRHGRIRAALAVLPALEEMARKAAALDWLETKAYDFTGQSGEPFRHLDWPEQRRDFYTQWPAFMSLLGAIEAAKEQR